VADVAAQAMRPDAKAAGSIEHAAAPGALMDQAIGGAWIGQRVERGERQLDQVGRHEAISHPQ